MTAIGVNSWEKEGNRIILAGENFNVEIEAFSDKIINIYASRGEKKSFSQAVVIKPKPVSLKVKEGGDCLFVATGTVKLKVNKENFSFTLSAEPFLLEAKELVVEENIKSCSLRIREDEHFYGLGERTGFLDKRGKRYTMWNADCYRSYVEGADLMYQSYPFYIGVSPTGSYGLYFDNTFKSFFDLGKTHPNMVTFGAVKGPLNFFLIYGPTLKEVVEGYTEITGRMELPPLWALGYQQSRYSYYPQERVLEVAREFRKRDIPCDVIYLDIHYMDGFKVFTFDQKRFPDPEGMIKELKEMGFKVVTIVDPGVKVEGEYWVFKEGLAKDYFVTDEDGLVFTGKVWPGRTAFPDFSREEVRAWWADLHREFLEIGIAGIWNDMNEPTLVDTSLPEPPISTLPPELVHKGDSRPMRHEEFHNLYALNMALATQKALLKFKPQERPFILTRSGFSGIQRYAAIWTGDNRSYWEHLKMSIPMLCNIGLSGEPFCGADIGGFAEDTTEELLIRWTQLGVFYPFCRNHTNLDTIDQEPWAFGKKAEDICREFIKLRYTLLPYIYNLFYRAWQKGTPVFRPLVFEYEKDENCHNISDEFLLGDSLLVAPVCEPGQVKRMVYLPVGEWVDWWSGELFEGGKYYVADAPLERIPLYVKAGAILPLTEPQNYVGEKPWEVEFLLFPGGVKGEYVYYEDDGASLDYQKGIYNLYRLSYERSGAMIKFTWAPIYKGFAGGQKVFKLVFKGEQGSEEVWVNGQKVEVSLAGEDREIFLKA